MKNKKWVLILIIAFPSFFWLILETSTINSKKLPFYGPKKAIATGDTSYYQVSDEFLSAPSDTAKHKLNDGELPLYAIVFISEKYRGDSYRLTGLWEYLNYKKSKIQHIPFVLVTPANEGRSAAYEELKKLDAHNNVHFRFLPATEFEKVSKSYFKEKPYYIDYSFFLLIDANRNVRGYYDGRYVSEIKRLIEEYQHLRLKEEKKQMIHENEIKSNS